MSRRGMDDLTQGTGMKHMKKYTNRRRVIDGPQIRGLGSPCRRCREAGINDYMRPTRLQLRQIGRPCRLLGYWPSAISIEARSAYPSYGQYCTTRRRKHGVQRDSFRILFILD